ncbi:1-cys peroxiredoxin [Mycena indigotica]|uniref:DnaJ homolog subfamily C member 16 n=1 Tax=Mycena indigotica TaxID=2126181 RepID=A0A8H6WH55_9AGAR|nr:1-cys peroxiredoxin [Mycena indigotica]KAF7312144.1 1-cys peroxiredoxin [Mycena indigotica]
MATFPKHEYTLRLGSLAPNFDAETTIGPINFHEWLGDSWGILFSHPGDFTPVCTTELGEVARRAPDFANRNVKVIGISANNLDDHKKWIDDINSYGGKVGPTDVQFPIIADADRKVSYIYDMLDYQDATNKDLKGLPFTIRTVFVIDPKKVIRLTLSYPAVAGRNFVSSKMFSKTLADFPRMRSFGLWMPSSLETNIGLQLASLISAFRVSISYPPFFSGVNWKPGDDVIVHASVGKEEAKTLFPDHVEHLPYLRTTPHPKIQYHVPRIFSALPIMAIPALPSSYTPPASTSKLSPPASQPSGKLLAAGPAYFSYVRLMHEHDGDVHAANAAARKLAEESAIARANGSADDDDLGVGDESEDEALLSLDPKEWKKQDNYRVLGLSHLRWRATPDQIKVAHRKKVLRHHPDKKAQDHTAASSLGVTFNTNDDAFFKCIQKAHEVLMNPERRRQFDSGKNVRPFLPTFAPIFERESRFSRVQPVPSLGVPTADGQPSKDPNDIEGHEFPQVKAHVEAFYDFWYNFDSWRSFEWLDKEVNEGSDARDDKRYTEKKNKAERARRKKEDIARVRGIVDLCLSVDPRIKYIKQQEKEAREAKKAGGKKPNSPAAAKKAEEEAQKKAEAEAKKIKDEEEALAKAEAKKAKAAAANAAKKARRAARAAEEA